VRTGFLIAVSIGVALVGPGWGQLDTYQTGFEGSETPAFTAGTYNFDSNNDIDGQGNWIVEAGVAAIQTSVKYAGSQALEIQASGSVDAPRSGGSAQEIWLQGRYRTAPQDTDPDVQSLEASSALMYFNTSEGIKVYNGTSRQWQAIGVQVEEDAWYRITIRLDFSNQTWDIWVEGEQKAAGLGFKDASVTSYNGFRCRSSDQAAGYLDDFYVSETAPAQLTPTVTPSPTVTPTPTETPVPPSAEEFLLYSIYWRTGRENWPTPSSVNETDYFSKLNLGGGIDIDWSDIFQFFQTKE
jgi:hypothetical protein